MFQRQELNNIYGYPERVNSVYNIKCKDLKVKDICLFLPKLYMAYSVLGEI